MTLSTQQMRACLQTFDFKRLFVEELGWNTYSTRIAPAEVDGVRCTFTPIAEQGGMVVVTCTTDDGNIPPSGARRKIDQHVTALAFEHLIIFVDRDSKGTAQTSLWWWVKREDGTTKPRTFTYRRGSMGDALLQKLAGIAFAIEDLDDEGQVSIATVTSRVKKAFDVETVTKKFYDQFKTEHSAFLTFLKGIPQDPDGKTKQRDWYASVMLNRLMFLYFIQKKRFLNDDPDYLRTKLEEMRNAGKNFYRDFLLILFFQGLACEEGEREQAARTVLGSIPYLNGGLFLPHSLEDQYGEQIAIADEAFERLFTFFDGYTWHLDERPLRQGNEINPDVLGYIFEKYINQKDMGAYYTKEDITGYICRSTILPFLLDKVGVDVRAILTDVEPYIYDAVSTEDYLPTETEREYTARRARYVQIQADFATGKITTVDDLVTYNLDIQALVEDWLRGLSDPVLLRNFYFECLLKLTVLDPTAGSGAFLFAAINILEPLYELALDKMRQIVGEPLTPNPSPTQAGRGESIPHKNVVKYLDFVDELKRVSAHPNRRYFVLKSIIVNNLYGVDIMDEATEICKLRLFLKMVAQVDSPAQIEPLPDIDFNIRAGNTLVGFATRGEIEGRLFATPELKRKVEAADRSLRNFRDLQTRIGVESSVFKGAKADIQAQLAAIRTDLDASLMDDYGQPDFSEFRANYKPFHWYVEFNTVLANKGFDVIVGNPPYVEYSEIRTEYEVLNFRTLKTGNLFALTLERAMVLLGTSSRYGVIVPISSISTPRMTELMSLLRDQSRNVHTANYAVRPGKLFVGVDMNLTIIIGTKRQNTVQTTPIFSTQYQRWHTEYWSLLFEAFQYQPSTFYAPTSSMLKFGSPIETSIWNKLMASSSVESITQGRKPSSTIFYHSGGRYFRKCLLEQLPNEYKPLDVPKGSEINFAGIFSSSLFYWFWLLTSDCYHVTKPIILQFRVPETLVYDDSLAEVSKRFLDDIWANSKKTERKRKDGSVKAEYNFSVGKSKPIIDEIDRVLARYYGFTEAELDFIIHYDIKYRMGRDAESDGDEGEE